MASEGFGSFAGPAGVSRAVTVRHLEMNSPSQLRPRRSSRQDLHFTNMGVWPELNRFFYTAVGGEYYWVDRLAWTYDEWRAHLERSDIETWMLSAAGQPAGYAELHQQQNGSIEIAYFGLVPRFVGGGLGGHLLTVTTERAWQAGARRVWLHTCSLDHPAALANYLARGFREFHTETQHRLLPPEPLGPWPGARS